MHARRVALIFYAATAPANPVEANINRHRTRGLFPSDVAGNQSRNSLGKLYGGYGDTIGDTLRVAKQTLE